MLKPIYKICKNGSFCYGIHHFEVENSILQLSRAHIMFISSERERSEYAFKKKKSRNTPKYVSTIFCIEKAGTKLVKQVLLCPGGQRSQTPPTPLQ